jgi:tetratricopeptide (TPR) repeat protein
MVKKSLILGFLLVFVLTFALSANPVLTKADALYWGDSYDELEVFLTSELAKETDPKERAEILWRLSRVTIGIADELKEVGAASKDELFAFYEKAEAYALQSIEEYPTTWGYVYKASSVGRWGETKGPLNALGKAAPMRDDFSLVIDTYNELENSITWYVLGQLYYQLPGWPISFGNLEYAISYTRRALETIPSTVLYPNHFKALAEMLWKRNWSASTRNSKIKTMQKEFDKTTRKNLDRYMYYEGANGPDAVPFYSPVALNKMSDKQEAVMLLQYAVSKYNAWSFHSRADKRAYAEIQGLLKTYGF